MRKWIDAMPRCVKVLVGPVHCLTEWRAALDRNGYGAKLQKKLWMCRRTIMTRDATGTRARDARTGWEGPGWPFEPGWVCSNLPGNQVPGGVCPTCAVERGRVWWTCAVVYRNYLTYPCFSKLLDHPPQTPPHLTYLTYPTCFRKSLNHLSPQPPTLLTLLTQPVSESL